MNSLTVLMPGASSPRRVGSYNTERPYSAHSGQTPAEAFRGDSPVEIQATATAEGAIQEHSRGINDNWIVD